MKKSKTPDNLLAENRKARHDYEITDTIECGIVLLGSEVKSVRGKKVYLQDCYGILRNGEVFLLNLRIDSFKQATHETIDPLRTRKLLLKKSEIKKVTKLLQIKKLNLIPLKIYLKGPYVKVLLGLGVSKSKIDKRHTIKERDTKKELARVLKKGGR